MPTCIVCFSDEGPFPSPPGHKCTSATAVMCDGCWKTNILTDKSRLVKCFACGEDFSLTTVLEWIRTLTNNFTSEEAPSWCQWFQKYLEEVVNIQPEEEALIRHTLHNLPFGTDLTAHLLDGNNNNSLLKCAKCRHILGCVSEQADPYVAAFATCDRQVGNIEVDGQTVPVLCNTRTCTRCHKEHRTEACPQSAPALNDRDLVEVQYFFFRSLFRWLVLEAGYAIINASGTRDNRPSFATWSPQNKVVTGWTSCAHMFDGEDNWCRRCFGHHYSTSCHSLTPPFNYYSRGEERFKEEVPRELVPMTIGGEHGAMAKTNLLFPGLVRMVFTTQLFLPREGRRLSAVRNLVTRIADCAELPESLLAALRPVLQASDSFREDHLNVQADIYRTRDDDERKRLWRELERAYEARALALYPNPSQQVRSDAAGGASSSSDAPPPAKRRRISRPPIRPRYDHTEWPDYAPPRAVEGTAVARWPRYNDTVTSWNNPGTLPFVLVRQDQLHPYQSMVLEPEAHQALTRAVRTNLSGEFWEALACDALKNLPGFFELVAHARGTGRGKLQNAQDVVRSRVAHKPGRSWVVHPTMYLLVMTAEAPQPLDA